MLPLCSVLLLCTAAAPPPLRAAVKREITVGTRWPQLIATNGKVFRNVKFTFVSPREVRFMHTDGIGSLPLGEVVMPDDVMMPVLGAGDSSLPPELTMGPLGSMMTPQERKVSGIDKLSNDEQATLAKWVLGTVEDRLKVELERRGLPPTFAPLETVPVAGLGAAAGEAGAVGGVPPASAAGPASAATPGAVLATPAAIAVPAAAVTARSNGALGSAALASEPQLMTAAPGRTYVPPSKPGSAAPSPLLPPPFDPAAPAPSSAARAPSAGLVPGPITSPPLPGTLAGGRQVSARAYAGVVESSIAGEFRGLEAGRQFRLVNGQTWQQEDAFVQDHLAYKPRVTIYPANDGWMMAVDGVPKVVRVLPVN